MRRIAACCLLLAILATSPAATAQQYEPELSRLLTGRDYQAALARTETLLKATPNDYSLRVLVPSLYARMGDDAAFDRESERLRQFRDASSDPKIRAMQGFPVQAIKAGDRSAMIHRCFEQGGLLKALYVAAIGPPEKPQIEGLLQIGASPAQEMLGGKGPKWSVDYYKPGGEHSTMNWLVDPLRYADVKAEFEKHLAGGRAMSSSNTPSVPSGAFHPLAGCKPASAPK